MAKPELTEWDTDLTAPLDEEYEALVRAIRYAQGFSLLFVQCSPAQGEEIIARVRDDVVDKTVDVLRLESEVDDLYDTVAALPNIDKTNVLFISGLEKSLVPYIKPGYGSEGDYYAKDSVPKILGRLNLQRENFRETFKLCFVFLVPLYAMKYLIRRAADFFDWRSGVWEFMGSADEVQQAAQHILQEGEYIQYLSWTPQRRRERILEIDDLLVGSGLWPQEKHRLYFEQGNLSHADQQFEWAIACFDAVLEIKPDDDAALNNKGGVLYALGRYEDAIGCYDAALAIKPDDDSALYNKGNVLADLGRYEDAIGCYEAALTIKPDKHEALYNKGNALYALGRREDAIGCYEAVLAIKPDDDSALYNKGNMLADLGRYEDAISYYEAALVIKPDKQEALNNKGVALADLGRYEDAISYYEAALAIKPDYQEALNNKGVALGILGRYEEAIGYYEAALVIKPDNQAALNNKGVVLGNLGRYEEAITCYDAAIAIKPDYQLAIENKKEVLGKLTNNSH